MYVVLKEVGLLPKVHGKVLTEGQKIQIGGNETYQVVCRNTVYFQPSPTARKICVKHLNDAVDLNQLYTPQVLTDDVLKLIEPQVAAKFTYGDELDQEELGNIITETVDDVTENS